MIELPARVRLTAESKGAAGREWLAGLPARVEQVCRAWSLTPVAALDGGSAALVVRVRTGDGADAVSRLAPPGDGADAVSRLAPPGDGFAGQVGTLAAANGHGYVRLYAHDPAHGAMLLEALGPALSATAPTPEDALDVLAATLLQAWLVPRPLNAVVPPGTDKASTLYELIEQLYPRTGYPCPPELIERALGYARRRADAFDLGACVVCHGDPHPGNVLAVPVPRPGAESGYVLVDPDGFLCDPAYDLGVAVRGWEREVLAAADPVALVRGWCARLSAATGVDENAIWEWGFVERVSSGLYMIAHGAPAEGREYLASAVHLSG
ncbi:MAG TPA: aminoglycoside phosphotransferase family protein [Candidatus Limnocylindrales bacterium]